MAAAPPLFALLVGINHYHPESGLPPLHGCVNDARALAHTITQRYGLPLAHVLTLLDEAATRAGILAALAEHWGARMAAWHAAGADPAAQPHLLFYFAGYGALTWTADPGGGAWATTLVAYDSRLPDQRDLAAADFAAYAPQGAPAASTLLLDCIHWPGATGTDSARACTPDLRPPIAPAPPRVDWPAVGAHVAHAARWGQAAHARAVADADGITWRSPFALALQQLLHSLPGGAPPVWGDFAAQWLDRTAALRPAQTPLCLGDADAPLLGGLSLQAAPPLTIDADEHGRLWLDAGTAHDLLPGSRLALYASAAPAARMALLEVARAGIERSACTLIEGALPAAGVQGARAVLLAPGRARARLQVAETIAAAAVQGERALPAALAARVGAVADVVDAAPDFAAVVDDAGDYWLCDADGAPCAGPFAPHSTGGIAALHVEVAQRARFAAALAQRGGVAALPPGSVAISVERLVFDEAGMPRGAPLDQWAGEPILPGGAPVVIHITNHSDHPLYVALLRFGPRCEIACVGPARTRAAALAPGATLTVGRSARPADQLHTPLPAGDLEARLLFRAYAAHAPFAADQLEQGALPAPGAPPSSYAGMSSAPQPPQPPWVMAERGLRLLAPAGAQPLDGAPSANATAGGWHVQPPPGWRGTLRLLGPTELARTLASVDGAPWPAGLAAHPAHFQPYAPRATAALDDARESPACAALALTCDDDARRLIAPASPLRLHLPAPSSAPLFAFAFDGADAYPLGRCSAGAPVLDIVWLPPCTADAPDAPPARAAHFAHTLHIYLCEVSGADAPEAGLFAARFVPAGWAATAARARFTRTVPGGQLRYTHAVPARPGERLALLLHGFADDSAAQAHWLTHLLQPAAVQPGAPHYDRLLCFEYESLHTGLEENARRLHAALAALRLNAAPGATLDIFAHSMGALLARVYIEQLGGDAAVRRCFFTGPPNQGTPLAATALWTPWLAALLLNLPLPTPPTLLIAWALGTLAWDAQGPADLRPGAPLLEQINGARGHARLRYHVLAGSVQDAPAEQPARLRRVLVAALGAAAHRLYAGDNDWVVSVRSSLAVPVGHHPGGLLLSRVVDATHLNYYQNAAVNEQMLRWLAAPADEPEPPPAPRPATVHAPAPEPPAAESAPHERRRIRFTRRWP